LRFNAAKYKVEYKTDKNVFHLIWLFTEIFKSTGCIQNNMAKFECTVFEKVQVKKVIIEQNIKILKNLKWCLKLTVSMIISNDHLII
jgi:hypothetical protein